MEKKLIKKNDFVEIEFTARTKEGKVFDTTSAEVAKLAGLYDENTKDNFKNFKICVGQGMILEGLDLSLENKEINKEYEIELPPEKAFGKRHPELVKLVPSKMFLEKNIFPKPGMVFSLDGILIKIISVSGGRVLIDMNNPLAGKEVIYKFKALRFIEDIKEKAEILEKFMLKANSEIRVDGKKLILSVKVDIPEQFKKNFSEKVKSILDLEVEFNKI